MPRTPLPASRSRFWEARRKRGGPLWAPLVAQLVLVVTVLTDTLPVGFGVDEALKRLDESQRVVDSFLLPCHLGAEQVQALEDCGLVCHLFLAVKCGL